MRPQWSAKVEYIARLRRGDVDTENGRVRHAIERDDGPVQIRHRDYEFRTRAQRQPNDRAGLSGHGERGLHDLVHVRHRQSAQRTRIRSHQIPVRRATLAGDWIDHIFAAGEGSRPTAESRRLFAG